MTKKVYKQTEKHKANISKNHADFSGKNNPMYGRKHKQSSKNKQRANRPDTVGTKNGMFGKGYLVAGEKNGLWKDKEYLGTNGRW